MNRILARLAAIAAGVILPAAFAATAMACTVQPGPDNPASGPMQPAYCHDQNIYSWPDGPVRCYRAYPTNPCTGQSGAGTQGGQGGSGSQGGPGGQGGSGSQGGSGTQGGSGGQGGSGSQGG